MRVQQNVVKLGCIIYYKLFYVGDVYMMTKDSAERIKRLKNEVAACGLNPADYRYDMNTMNAYRIEKTKLGEYVYIVVPHKNENSCREAKVDIDCFYSLRLYSYRWIRSSSNPKKDYPHTNTYDSTGKRVNLLLHIFIMGGTISGKVIDHNDGDHYNASRSNLNYVSPAQNNQNRHPSPIYAKRKINEQYIPLFAS